MSDLTAFLLARIAEDEAPARTAIEHGGNPVHEGGWILKLTGTHVELHVAPARVLAECEAKRRIVESAAFMLKAWEDKPGGAYPDMNRRERHNARVTLSVLALPYADHPDYREDWRP